MQLGIKTYRLKKKKKIKGIPNTHTVYTLNLKRIVSIARLTQTAVAEVLPETHVAQLGGRDLAHLQSHSGALAHRLHAHTHGLHF